MRRVFLVLAFCLRLSYSQSFDPKYYAGLQWRMIGPFRGGRTVGAAGIPQLPNVFYIGVNNGGVWKTDDYGRTWNPLFDGQPTGSIGAIAVAPSNPNILYVGSGEGLQRPDLSVGDGIYKSIDRGKTWQHLGLRDGQQIPAILVDPRDPNRVFAAVLGHPYGPNAERGVFRSTDGGVHWEKVLYKDEHTGAVDLAFDPRDPRTVFAVLWEAQQGPGENGAFSGANSGLYKSTDGGATWKQLTGGLPDFAKGLGRIGIGIAASDPARMYALVEAKEPGLYRSDDAGNSWTLVNSEVRISGRGNDFACVRVDPQNKDTVYVANTSTYRSSDAGKTFTAIKGAPGGDDYHTIWINPENPNIILLALDQGATISVNHGATWSSWYNQPTAQFYHVSTDDQFPYWVYGGQQESGSAAVKSRGDWGEITVRDWHTVGVDEYDYVAPDPLNPNLVYGGKCTRFNAVTGETQSVAPKGDYRFLRTAPLLFSYVDPHTLYLGAQVVLKTTNGGQTWEAISPDLTRPNYDVPASTAFYADAAREQQAKKRAVVYSIGPSRLNVNVIWAGTDDGLIHVTRDGGKSWKNVTPPGMTPWSKVAQLDASHFDDDTVYAAVNRFRLDDLKPHIYRTHDGGATWQETVAGLPDAPVNAVREDPVRRGLLYAATELAVYCSFDDGEHWEPLRLNMPATSIRDLVIHENDLVVGTHGRGFWILDDVAPLRQLNAEVAGSAAHLFVPSVAYRLPRSTNTDTPLPPEEPAGKNPPDGAVLYYWLGQAAAGEMTLEILDSTRQVVRRYSSGDRPVPPPATLDVPLYWLRPFQPLATEAGMHRFVWDLHGAPKVDAKEEPSMGAVYRDTPMGQGEWMPAGTYTVRLTVEGKAYERVLVVRGDPRH